MQQNYKIKIEEVKTKLKLICIIISICLAYWLQDAIIIFATSFIGAYTFIRGISLFAGGYPNEFTVIDLKNQGEDGQLKELITWRVWIYLVAIIIVTGLSIFIQFKIDHIFRKS